MQPNGQDQALENLANGKTPKGKRGGMAKTAQPSGELGESAMQRHATAGRLGKQQALQDLSAMGQSYSATLAAGMNAFNGVASNALEGLLSDEFQIDAAGEGDFDFLEQVVMGAFPHS